GLLRPLALTGDDQRAVLELNRDLVFGEPGKIERVDELVVLLPDVDGRNPGPGRGLAVCAHDRIHEPAHVVLERRDLAERLPTNQSRHLSLLSDSCCSITRSPI